MLLNMCNGKSIVEMYCLFLKFLNTKFILDIQYTKQASSVSVLLLFCILIFVLRAV